MFILFIVLAIVISVTIFFLKKKIVTTILSIAFLIMLVFISGYAYINIDKSENIIFKYDSIGVLLSIVLCILSITTFYFSRSYLKHEDYNSKKVSLYYSALIMLITAVMTIYFSKNLAVLWVIIEATSLFVSILIFFERSKLALEAAWKYLFVSSIGIALAFIGILLMSIAVSNNGLNDLSFETLTNVVGNMDTLWLKISVLLIFTGFSVKLSVFPFYAVAVDAKTVAPSPINAIMSTALVNVGFIAFFRIFAIISNTQILAWAQNVLLIMGLLSIFIASIQLTRVKRLKRTFAFSTMEHMGIITLGLAVGGIGYYAVILHIVLHSFVKAGLFYQINQIHTVFKSKWINDFSGYFKINPLAGLSLLLGFICVVAIPPSGLFVSEFLIFKALFLRHHYCIAIVALVLLSVIMYLMAKIFLGVLFGNAPDNIKADKTYRLESAIQLGFFGLSIYLGINPPAFFVDLINNAVSILI